MINTEKQNNKVYILGEVLTKASCSEHCINGEDGCSAYNCKAENCKLRQATIMAVELLKAKAEEE